MTPEIIYLNGLPHRVLSQVLIQSWDEKGKPFQYTAMRVEASG